jgi:SAM-dependent methyltransferase/GNAT superfamily N-acetyltransferase
MRTALWPETSAEGHAGEVAAFLTGNLVGWLLGLHAVAAFVADRPGGGLCGFLEASVRPLADGCTTHPVGYVEGWYVDPDVRRQGVGRRLVEAAQGWASSHGCREMASDARLANAASIAAHRALGFSDEAPTVRFRKRLPPAGPAGTGMADEPLALAAYERLADAYADRVDTKAHNAFYDRPAVLSLLPPVAGKRVLDAGCGPGAYAAWLADRGAEVVGLDVSPRMVERARRRLRGRAAVLRADLGRLLDFLPAASFDLVRSALTLDYVRDWDAAFAEFGRLLRSPGHLVFSVGHPADEFYDRHPRGNYFDVERVEDEWRGFGPAVRVPYYRRPLGAVLGPLLGAGFALERLLEPRPVPQFREHDAADYAKLMRQPGFLCVRARKAATS